MYPVQVIRTGLDDLNIRFLNPHAPYSHSRIVKQDLVTFLHYYRRLLELNKSYEILFQYSILNQDALENVQEQALDSLVQSIRIGGSLSNH